MRGWRAYYTDGREYASTETEWTALPDEGVLGVVVYHDPPYRTIVDGGDWYYLEDGMVYATATHDEWGEWIPQPDKPDVKRGAAVSDDEWERVQARMMDATRR